MKARAVILLVLVFSTPAIAEDLKQIAIIDLPKVEGRFDHFAIDVAGKRLFLAALANNSLEVIDIVNNKRLLSIPNLKKPTGAAYIPQINRLVVASGDDGMCRFFDGNPLKLVGEIKDLDDADNVRYDAAAKKIYLGYGSGALAVIDPGKMQKVADIKLEAHPESFQIEKNGKRIFVNLPDAHQVAVVDRERGAVIGKWALKDPSSNFPMALDEAHKRVFVGCRRPARLVVLDMDSGRQTAQVECVGDTDDLFYDAAQQRIYISGGEGAITILHQLDADHYQTLGALKTSAGSRTSFFSSDLGALYLAVPRRGGQNA